VENGGAPDELLRFRLRCEGAESDTLILFSHDYSSKSIVVENNRPASSAFAHLGIVNYEAYSCSNGMSAKPQSQATAREVKCVSPPVCRICRS
jgi:hypothetical protein